jgi:hypothetical protein
MATISKTAFPIVGDDKFMKVITCDAKGVFKISLPGPVCRITGVNHVTAGSLKDVERAFSDKISEWIDASTSTRKVILYQVDKDQHFAKGVTISLAADVFNEITIRSDGKERINLEDITGNPLKKTRIRNGTHEWRWGGHGTKKIAWTEEREAFFVKLASAIEAVRDTMNQLNGDAAEDIIDGRQQFIPPAMNMNLPGSDDLDGDLGDDDFED